ncbi:MAG: glycine radical domain-containing protein [Desulfobacterales bacterium]
MPITFEPQKRPGHVISRAYNVIFVKTCLSLSNTGLSMGLDHVQFNMVSDETLRAAQKGPEKYSEVIVRVAGYSAYFVDISRKTQDNIIKRTVQGI